jgi:hypothetical protein
MFAIGIIKAPPRHPLFKECIDNVSLDWNNVNVCTAACKKYGSDLTHPKEYFHPFSCGQQSRYLRKTGYTILLKEGEIYPTGYSIHYFGNKGSRVNITPDILPRFPNSVLFKLCQRVFGRCSYENH